MFSVAWIGSGMGMRSGEHHILPVQTKLIRNYGRYALDNVLGYPDDVGRDEEGLVLTGTDVERAE